MSDSHASLHALKRPGKLKLPTWYFGLAGLLAIVGGASFFYELRGDPHRAWGAYLIGFFFFLLLALAGPFFTAVQFLSSAGWSVTVRRIPEAMGAYLVPAAALAAGLFLGVPSLYHWAHHDAVLADVVLMRKAPYLNITRMGVFTAIAFLAWIGLSGWIVRNSRTQDRTADPRLTYRNARLSAVFMIAFALTLSVSAFDFLMSLDPHWASTMWAVYVFAMLMQSGMALIALSVVLIRRTGKLDGFVSDAHVHDLGKFVFAFTVFYAYIAFSQFLLIWYANLPDETPFFLRRFADGWGPVSVALPFVKFFIPFLVLLPWRSKHTPAIVIPTCLWILAATFLEMWWIVMPNVLDHGPSVPWMEMLISCGFLGVFLAAFGWSLSRHELVPVNDPRLNESVHHHAE